MINIVMFILAIAEMGIVSFFLVDLYKQHKNLEKSEYIELFPENDIYIKNAYEGECFNISDEERMNSERLAATQRGAVRIACSVYFTTTEYEKYREKILASKLP